MVAILCRLCFLMSPFVCHFFLKGGQFYGAGSFSGLCPIRCVIYYTVLYEGSPLVGECLEIGNFLSEDVNHRKCTHQGETFQICRGIYREFAKLPHCFNKANSFLPVHNHILLVAANITQTNTNLGPDSTSKFWPFGLLGFGVAVGEEELLVVCILVDMC